MSNMLDYIKWRGDLSFDDSPFNEIDAMIFSQLAGIDYTDVVPGAKTVEQLECNRNFLGYDFGNLNGEKYQTDRISLERVAEIFKERVEDETKLSKKEKLIFALGESDRFKKITMGAFIHDTNDEEQKQFSAVTFFLDRRNIFIAFRGTDGSITSWRENFNMVYQLPMAGQKDALTYIEKMSKGYFSKIRIGGHSKGGNLSLYAAAFSDERIQKKIVDVYCFDAPGFMTPLSEVPGYSAIRGRLHTYIPESSVVGRMLNYPENPVILLTDAAGMRQHSMFHWMLEGKKFISCDGTDSFSEEMTGVFTKWTDNVPLEERKEKIDEFFDLLAKHEIHSFDELINLPVKKKAVLFTDVTRLSAENRELLINLFKDSAMEEGKSRFGLFFN